MCTRQTNKWPKHGISNLHHITSQVPITKTNGNTETWLTVWTYQSPHNLSCFTVTEARTDKTRTDPPSSARDTGHETHEAKNVFVNIRENLKPEIHSQHDSVCMAKRNPVAVLPRWWWQAFDTPMQEQAEWDSKFSGVVGGRNMAVWAMELGTQL